MKKMINPKDSVVEVVQRLKSRSSRVIRRKFPELEEFLWGDNFWVDGYFAETFGNVDKESCDAIHKRPMSVIVLDHARKPEILGFTPERDLFE